MASRIARVRAILPDLESALQSFSASPSKFRIVQTINPSTIRPRTLYILDSSFNPPSIAHFALAVSALKGHTAREAGSYRLLLLFSTHNADKSPQPAGFSQRIALMIAFAEDVLQSLKTIDPFQKADIVSSTDIVDVSIDIGLTKEPYYTDKSAAISKYSPPIYAPNLAHVHLIGFDTFIRLCNPKYYPRHNPPLSALKPYFESGHKFCVIQRPVDAKDDSSREFGTVHEQKTYLQNLKNGAQAQVGFESVWAEAITMVEADESIGVSSTRVRKAVQKNNWSEVNDLCTSGVADWIKEQGLYQ